MSRRGCSCAASRAVRRIDGRCVPSRTTGDCLRDDRCFTAVIAHCPPEPRHTIARELKGLQDIVSMSVTHWLMADDGWNFAPADGVVPDDVNGVEAIWQLYAKSDAGYSGRATVPVPVLWDKQRQCIVSNESADILRMFNSAFDGVGAAPGDLYPQALRGEIDALNARIYDTLNNGVYKAGFATSQHAYDDAVQKVFATLDWLEGLLADRTTLCGDALTEADWRLFTTLLRFDAVYHGHFKCNLRRVVDYPALMAYTRRLYQQPGVRGTVDFAHIKRHYYQSHRHINPTGIVPAGPDIDFSAPPGA